ncbi:enoyl-CoA hydratase [Sphingomonas ginsenosidivorax]|uniref:Enoyl-CoA hydratase n=1 Tax=Sphingomonas ginsenosidivorax TaxID=862135 RepID=A0A5C6UGA4_9SPHN|nr:enoyl-CoA hydratase-related protein [Sphingomonas ginsenosidivorax]TXC71075.1 enoyl-CoA hydratase [Sphingomonas ginsenosidivorax]
MTDAKVLIERHGPIALVTLNDPETRNALSPAVVAGLVAFLEGANADESLGCIVLTGAGGAFCSGGNIKDMQEGTDPQFAGTPDRIQEAFRAGIQRIPALFDALDVPAIAAVNGVAVGAGCDITCMCDIRIGATRAKFAESFLRVGLVSGDGGAWFLPRVVGYPRAIEMALTCRMIEADEAKAWGLVTHVVEADALLDTAMEMARTITAFPPRSARLNKRLMRKSMSLDLASCLELSAAYQAIVQHTADQKEAVAALLEKRPARFTGR